MTTTRTAHSPQRRRWRGWMSLLGGLATGALASGPAQAAGEVLPAATFGEVVFSSVDPNQSAGKDLLAPESITYSFVRAEDVLSGYAMATGGAVPSLQAGVTALGRGNDQVTASVSIRYFVRLDGLAYGTPVAMQMSYSAWATSSGDGAQAWGWVTLEGGGDKYNDQVNAGTLPGMPQADAMDAAFSFNMKAGMPYRVDLYGGAIAMKGEATAYIDPVFKFAPGVDSTGLTLTYSAGVSPVPEPSSALLLAAGLAACSLLWCKKRG